MPQLATGKGKEAMETLLNAPSLCDVQAPAPKGHTAPRPFSSGHHGLGVWGRAADTATTTYPAELRYDIEPMDHDMISGSEKDQGVRRVLFRLFPTRLKP